MKAFKSVKKLSLIVSLIFVTSIYSSAIAQEYDDMYFNKTDRKTVKIEKTTLLTNSNKNNSYKEITKSTETFSAKNVNPEYIARYKSTESNQVNEQTVKKNDSYSSNDYFVEGYDKSAYVSDSKNGEIDYAALNKRDQMSSKKNYGSLSNSAMRFSPYMAMGFGSAYGRYGYDPFMMGYGSGMSMGFGSGFGYSPYMSFNVGMSWGSGYNPWGSFYNPYRMRGYDPWRSMYGYSPYGGLGGYSPYYGYGSGYGGYYPTFNNSHSNNHASEYNNGRNIQYKPRTTRVNSTINTPISNNENLRTSSSNSKIRVPSRTTSTTRSNGRIGNDYSKSQNEYYNKVRRSSSSARRISSNNSSRDTYSRNSSSVSRSKSSINNNKPSRVSSYSSGYNRNNSSSKSFSSPSRSSSSSSYSGRSNSTSSGSSYRSTGSSSRSNSSSRSSSSSSAARSGRR